jgi:hypothetical protein
MSLSLAPLMDDVSFVIMQVVRTAACQAAQVQRTLTYCAQCEMQLTVESACVGAVVAASPPQMHRTHPCQTSYVVRATAAAVRIRLQSFLPNATTMQGMRRPGLSGTHASFFSNHNAGVQAANGPPQRHPWLRPPRCRLSCQTSKTCTPGSRSGPSMRWCSSRSSAAAAMWRCQVRGQLLGRDSKEFVAVGLPAVRAGW